MTTLAPRAFVVASLRDESNEISPRFTHVRDSELFKEREQVGAFVAFLGQPLFEFLPSIVQQFVKCVALQVQSIGQDITRDASQHASQSRSLVLGKMFVDETMHHRDDLLLHHLYVG